MPSASEAGEKPANIGPVRTCLPGITGAGPMATTVPLLFTNTCSFIIGLPMDSVGSWQCRTFVDNLTCFSHSDDSYGGSWDRCLPGRQSRRFRLRPSCRSNRVVPPGGVRSYRCRSRVRAHMRHLVDKTKST